MKKQIFLIFLLFFLFGCNTKEPIEESGYIFDIATHQERNTGIIQEHSFNEQNECTICGFIKANYIDDYLESSEDLSFDLSLDYYGDINQFTFKVLDEKIAKINNGRVNCLKEGTTCIELYYQDVLLDTLNLKVYSNEINANNDPTIIQELNDILNFSDYEYCTVDSTLSFMGTYNKTTTKLKKNPLYICFYDQMLNATIIKEEDGLYYSYTNVEKDIVDRIFIEDSSEALLSELGFIIQFSASKIEVQKIDSDTYYLKTSSEDILKLLGFDDIDILNKQIIHIIIENKDELKMTSKLILPYEVESAKYVMTIESKSLYSFDPFEEIDLSNKTFSKATCIEEALLISSNKELQFSAHETKYFKIYLNAGTYSFVPTVYNVANYNINYISLKTYDDKYNQINLRQDLEDTSVYPNRFVIENEGIYCFELTNNSYADVTFALAPYAYVKHNLKVLKTDSNVLFDGYDYVSYYYVSDSENDGLLIKNQGLTTIHLYDKHTHQTFDIKPNDEIIINPTIDGINYYYIFDPQCLGYEYQMQVEILHGKEDDSIITDTYGDYYLYGMNYPLHQFTLDITEDKIGVYEFYCRDTSSEKVCNIKLLSYNGNYSNVICSKKLILNAGTYVLTYIPSDDNINEYCQIKYKYYDISDKTYDIELPVMTNSFEFPNLYHENELVLPTQIIKYNFSLTEDTNVIYELSTIVIYDENDNQVSINTNNSINDVFMTIKLSKGNYYAIPKYYGYSIDNGPAGFHLGINNIEGLDSFTYDCPIVNEGTMNLDYTWDYSASYYRLIPTENKTITISSNNAVLLIFTRANIVNAENHLVAFNTEDNYSMTITLMDGLTYYFVITTKDVDYQGSNRYFEIW